MASYVGEWQKSKPSDYITCYIYNLITDERIQFRTIPDGVNENYSAEWTSQDIMGRSAPYLAYMGNPARTADYSVLLDRNIMGDPSFQNTINQCKKLVYPKYTGGGIVVPPYCYVRFGGMVKMFAVVESVGVSWSGPVIADSESEYATTQSKDPNKNLLSQCELSFSFTEIRTRGQLLPTGSSLNEFDKQYGTAKSGW